MPGINASNVPMDNEDTSAMNSIEKYKRKITIANKSGDTAKAAKYERMLNALVAARSDADAIEKSSKKRTNDDDNVDKNDIKLTKKQKKNKKQKEISNVTTTTTGGDDTAATISWRKNENMEVSEAGFAPIMAFSDVPFPKELMKTCASFTTPTPIQSQTWPILVAGRDSVGIAETGSGKTLAFCLPGMQICKASLQDSKQHQQKKKNIASPSMLVLAPTRELALQSADVMCAVGEEAGISVVCVYGGAPREEQKRQMLGTSKSSKSASGSAVAIVATPGRLKDFMEDGSLSLEKVQYLVLDEADRMLDMGFEKEVRRIVSQCPKSIHKAADGELTRQTAMFSATWPTEIRALASEFMSSPVRVTIGGDSLTANRRVSQKVEVFDDQFARERRLKQLLNEIQSKGQTDRVIIFALYKKEAARIEQSLSRDGWNCVAIHGDRTQRDREAAVASFKDKSIPMLIATDVAARGLDIPGVEHVINFSFPLTVEDYVHRIGRTGRAGKFGASYTFFHAGDKALAGGLVNVLKEAGQPVPEALCKFGLHTKKKEHKLYGAHFRDMGDGAVKKATKIKFDD